MSYEMAQWLTQCAAFIGMPVATYVLWRVLK